ncbi:MAG TPA: hypothetical protein VI424_20245, partial [Terriglobales bacterium]
IVLTGLWLEAKLHYSRGHTAVTPQAQTFPGRQVLPARRPFFGGHDKRCGKTQDSNRRDDG